MAGVPQPGGVVPPAAPAHAPLIPGPVAQAVLLLLAGAAGQGPQPVAAAVVVGPRAPIRGTLSAMVALPALVQACAANGTVPLVGFYHDQAPQHIGRVNRGVSIFLTAAGRAYLGGDYR